MSTLTRRDFVGAAVATSAGVALGAGVPTAAARDRGPFDAAIIGAGAAGIAALSRH